LSAALDDSIEQLYKQTNQFNKVAKESAELDLKVMTEDRMKLMENRDERLPDINKKAQDLQKAVSKLQHVMSDKELDERLELLKDKIRDKMNLQGEFYEALANDTRYGKLQSAQMIVNWNDAMQG
jgi:N12 class adenine-specific DNA methylase